MSKNTFNYSAAAKRVTDREVARVRLAPDYASLVQHFNLSHESSSETITDAARTVVVDGARQAGTRVGESLTADMLKGRDPGADAAHRDYWKAARAVRIGLVEAMGENDSPKKIALRVSLSGEGGGSVTVPTDHALYDTLVALIGESK